MFVLPQAGYVGGKLLTQIVSTKRRFLLERRRTLDASATTAVNTRCLNMYFNCAMIYEDNRFGPLFCLFVYI